LTPIELPLRVKADIQPGTSEIGPLNGRYPP
jgi:hypothetical protein